MSLKKGMKVAVVSPPPIVGEVVGLGVAADQSEVTYIVEYERDGEKVQRHFREEELEVQKEGA